jgi:hypothetical protein
LGHGLDGGLAVILPMGSMIIGLEIIPLPLDEATAKNGEDLNGLDHDRFSLINL